MRKSLKAQLLLSAVLGLGCAANAAIIETDLPSDSETGFDANILNNDLIENGAPTVASMTATPGANFPASGASDGTATHNSGLVYYGSPPAGGVDLTYFLNLDPGTGGSATGYNLSSINSIYGWQDSRYRHAAQEWVVSVATTTNPTLVPQYSVVYAPFSDSNAGSTQVTLTNLTGTFPTNVTEINFHLTPYTGPGATGEIGVVREFDVLGVPAPEPTSLALLGFGGLGLLARRRRA